MQSIDIFGFNSGYQKNKKPFLFPEDGFISLENAYAWREEIKKREGLKLIGRLRRSFPNTDLGVIGASPWTFNIYSNIASPIIPEANAEIEPGSVRIYVTPTTVSDSIISPGYTLANDCEVYTNSTASLSTGDYVTITGVNVIAGTGSDTINGGVYKVEVVSATSFKLGIDSHGWGIWSSGGTWTKVSSAVLTFTDTGDGLLTCPTLGNKGYVNYLTGDVVLTHTAVAGQPVTITFAYFPSLPVMGIRTRELTSSSNTGTLWFDTKYCYIHDGSNFQEFIANENVTWNGTDSDFFWTTNFRGSDANDKLFFETNFVLSAGSPMRYTAGGVWNTFQPIIGGTTQNQVLTSELAAGSGSYGPAYLANLPIVEGTVVITVTINDNTEDDIIFRDTPKDGTLVSTGTYTGTINYTTGEINLSFVPPLTGTSDWTVSAAYTQGSTLLFTARILIPYYGRLLALNTYEGTSVDSAVNYFARCRFSQVGNPIQQDAWRSDTFGKGGFIDAPTNEQIISATFYKNTLIVSFESSTWKLQYLGEYGTPFIWERISSDFGSESPFSSVLFDNGVLTVGNRAIVGSSGSDVQRIDLLIPDQVYDFQNTNNGPLRVHGIRDFKKELVYWCFYDYTEEQPDQYYPNKTLVYNYRNNTFAIFRNNVTEFGNFIYPTGITWDREDIFWDNENVFWNNEAQESLPLIASGNQQGFCHFYGYEDVETTADSTINLMDQESLSVTNVTVGATVVLEIKNHNLLTNEFIYLTGLNYVVTATSTAGSTTLNDNIYAVQVQDKDNVILFQWNDETENLVNDFTVTNTGTYMGGGVVALLPRLYIETKDFNPLKQPLGTNIKTSYIDFLFDVSSPSPVSVIMKMNTNPENIGNLLIGNNQVETANSKTGFVSAITRDDPCVVTCFNHCLLTGDEISFQDVGGMTELNGNKYTITFITTDTFSLDDTNSSGYGTYTKGGYWEQVKEQYFSLSSQYTWHRFFATCFGQFFGLILTYDDELMSKTSTHQQNFVLNAMKLYFRPGGRNIFGK